MQSRVLKIVEWGDFKTRLRSTPPTAINLTISSYLQFKKWLRLLSISLNLFLDWQGGYTNITSGLSAAFADMDTSDDVQDVRSVITRNFYNRYLDFDFYIRWVPLWLNWKHVDSCGRHQGRKRSHNCSWFLWTSCILFVQSLWNDQWGLPCKSDLLGISCWLSLRLLTILNCWLLIQQFSTLFAMMGPFTPQPWLSMLQSLSPKRSYYKQRMTGSRCTALFPFGCLKNGAHKDTNVFALVF